MMLFSIPLPILFLALVPLLYPVFRAASARKERATFFSLFPVLLYFVLLLLVFLFQKDCDLCRRLPSEGLLLTLSLTATILCYLPVLPEVERRSPAPVLLPVVLTLASVVFLQQEKENIYLGGAVLAEVLCFSSFLLGGAYPGSYLRFFPIRLGVSGLILGFLFLTASRLSQEGTLLFLLTAVLLLLPAPFPRRSEKVLFPGFLRADQVLFVCLPPLLVFHLFRGLLESTFAPSWPFLSVGILAAMAGLLFAKTALFVEELADGLTVAGTGFMVSGLLTFHQQGREGALFFALLLPLATALSGLSLSFLSQRFRTRTFQGLTGRGTTVEPLRLAFLFGAFQGMSLPLVGGLLGEWMLLQGLSSFSLGLAILAVGGIFLTFVLVLGRTRILFSGEPDARLSHSDQILASEVRPAEGWALGLASFFLLMIDLIGSFGLVGGG